MYQESLKLLDMSPELKKKIFGESQKIDLEWVRGLQGKALFSVWTENLVSLFNSLVTCMFGSATQFLMVGFGPTTYSEIINKITGWNTTYDELMKIGERIFNLQRLFNYRLQHWDHRNDTFSDKQAYEPAQMGIYKGRKVPWDEVLREYYAIRGWSNEGVPTRTKLFDLNLEKIANKIDLPET